MLKRFGMDKCKATISPLVLSSGLVPSKESTKMDSPFSRSSECFESSSLCICRGLCFKIYKKTKWISGMRWSPSSAIYKKPILVRSSFNQSTTSNFADNRTRTGTATLQIASQLLATRSCWWLHLWSGEAESSRVFHCQRSKQNMLWQSLKIQEGK